MKDVHVDSSLEMPSFLTLPRQKLHLQTRETSATESSTCDVETSQQRQTSNQRQSETKHLPHEQDATVNPLHISLSSCTTESDQVTSILGRNDVDMPVSSDEKLPLEDKSVTVAPLKANWNELFCGGGNKL